MPIFMIQGLENDRDSYASEQSGVLGLGPPSRVTPLVRGTSSII